MTATSEAEPAGFTCARALQLPADPAAWVREHMDVELEDWQLALLEDLFRGEVHPSGVVFARTRIEPVAGWQRVAPGLLALPVPLPLLDHELDGRGSE